MKLHRERPRIWTINDTSQNEREPRAAGAVPGDYGTEPPVAKWRQGRL